MNIFLSGMMRSGTTLLQRALNYHDDISLSYQDKTSIFLSIAKRFHQNIGLEKYHLLSHYSGNTDYSLAEFNEWMKANIDFSVEFGNVTSEGYVGVKEVLAEEFIPFFLENDVKCINIVRDPRDVIASMSFGKGKEHTGIQRPVLFDVKNWRKSVVISQMLKRHENFLLLTMEDLLKNPKDSLAKICDFLEVSHFDFEELVKKMNSSKWKGNSSFGEKKAFDPSAIGGYKNNVPDYVVRYIETICAKEMQCMGYELSCDSLDKGTIIDYKDPFEVSRPEFDSDFSSLKENTDYEVKRFDLSVEEVMDLEFNGMKI